MGKKKKGLKKLKLSKLTARYVGTPYRLAGQNTVEGLDCLTLVLSLARDLMVPVPAQFEGSDGKNHAELWTQDSERAKARFIRFVKTLGPELPPHRAFAGDLLILKGKETGDTVVALHAGGDVALTAWTDVGCHLINTRLFDIKRVINWRRR